MMDDYAEQTFTTNGVALNYVEGPASGAPLVFLHWASARWQSWNAFLPRFAEGHHVFAVDARGHGKSSRTPGHYRFVDHAGDTGAFLREVVKAPAALVGHSLGGMQAAMAAAEQPDLVRGAVLVDPSLFVPERGLSASRRGFEGVRAQAGRPVEELAESLPLAAAESRSLLDPDVMEPWLDGSVGAGVATEDVLSQVQCPVLLVHGDPAKGGVLEPEEVRRISELLRDVQIEAVDAGHAIPSAEPELLATLIEGFVSRIDSSTE